MKQKTKKSNGFTIIELLATIAIISILTTLTITAISSNIKQAKEQKEKLNIQSIQEASILYIKENKQQLNITTIENYICITVEQLIQKGYLKESILDNQIYEYSYVKVSQDKENLTYGTSELISSKDQYDQECITE